MINVNFSPSFKDTFKKLIKGNRNLKDMIDCPPFLNIIIMMVGNVFN